MDNKPIQTANIRLRRSSRLSLKIHSSSQSRCIVDNNILDTILPPLPDNYDEVVSPFSSSLTSSIITLDQLIKLCERREQHNKQYKNKQTSNKKSNNIKKKNSRRTLKTTSQIKTMDTIDLALDTLLQILPDLKELQSMIGMNNVKQSIVDHVLYIVQNMHSIEDMNHIQIVGDSGIGKTTLAIIIGHIFAGLGLLQYGNVISVNRSDFIGEHLGSTSIKTLQTLELCKGNVLFIDEVYSFGCPDKKDSFSKECIDCITMFLSEYRHDILCIIAGYENDIKECFFGMNKGLERRFPWKYTLEKYTAAQLHDIFVNQVKLAEWTIKNDDQTTTLLNTIFKDTSIFPHYGGDTEILLLRCKIANSSRTFLNTLSSMSTSFSETTKRELDYNDIKNGFESFKTHQLTATTVNKDYDTCKMMYI